MFEERRVLGETRPRQRVSFFVTLPALLQQKYFTCLSHMLFVTHTHIVPIIPKHKKNTCRGSNRTFQTQAILLAHGRASVWRRRAGASLRTATWGTRAWPRNTPCPMAPSHGAPGSTQTCVASSRSSTRWARRRRNRRRRDQRWALCLRELSGNMRYCMKLPWLPQRFVRTISVRCFLENGKVSWVESTECVKGAFTRGCSLPIVPNALLGRT